ncbi:hypothetical protein VPH35_059542 [Triticum aestivum]
MHDAFMQDQVALDLDGFPLDHEFPEDYGLEEENQLDINREPLFEDELANQAVGAKPSARASGRKHTRRPRTSSFVSVGGTLGEAPRSVPKKRHQTFGFVSIVSFMIARILRRTKCIARTGGRPFRSDGG